MPKRATLAFAATVAHLRLAHAGEATLAEPIVEENITDVDATRVGTVEVDLTGTSMMPRAGGRAGSWSSEVEAEWRPVDRLGLGAGFGATGLTSGLVPSSIERGSPHVAVSYVLVRDRRRRLFVQPEAFARYPDDPVVNPTEPALPYGVGVRWAVEVGRLCLRAGLFGEGGAAYSRAPIRQSFAVLLRLLGAGPRLDVGAEYIQDWARAMPTSVVPEALISLRVLAQPMRLGIGAPMTFGTPPEEREVGVAFRLVFEPED